MLGSAVGMDKDVMKRLLRDAGIPIGKFIALKQDEKISFEKVKMTPGILIKFTRQNNSIADRLDKFIEKVMEPSNKDVHKFYLKSVSKKK